MHFRRPFDVILALLFTAQSPPLAALFERHFCPLAAVRARGMIFSPDFLTPESAVWVPGMRERPYTVTQRKGLLMKFDVLIVGGGPAGLSAALILGRCHRTALLCDEGQQRNLSSQAIHGLLGREGRSPAAFLDEARQELTRYKSVSVRGTRVTDIMSVGDDSNLAVRTARPAALRKSLLATGLVDELPELAGIEPLYGVSVHHCLYCDGFEYAGKPVAALGQGG